MIWIKSLLGLEGLGEVFEPRLGAADATTTQKVGSQTNKLETPAAVIGSDWSLELIGLAAPPSEAAFKDGTSSASSTVVPPNTVAKHTLTHFIEIS